MCFLFNLFSAQYYLDLEENEKAASIYWDLLERNPENWAYYKGLEKALKPQDETGKLSIYEQAMERFPRAGAPRRLPLDFVTGDNFRTIADKLMRKSLTKGMPPLFVMLRSLYAQPDKVQILEDLVVGYVESLKEHELFNKAGKFATPMLRDRRREMVLKCP